MLHGDLSNEVVPRLLLVFEGALGHISPRNVDAFNKAASLGEWPEAWRQWDLNELMMRKIWDVVYRQSVQIEVVTYVAPPESAEALAERLDEENLPVSRVVASTAQRTARRLAYGIDIAAVYDSNPETWNAYGSKGVALKSVHQFGRV